MPVKVKFRRKSSGNALENQESPPVSSFRVIPREEVQQNAAEKAGNSKRMSLIRPLSSPSQPFHQQSSEGDSGISLRGSEGSSASNSAVSRVYDTSSSSARLSSSSTLPSSTTDAENEEFSKRKSISTPTSDWRSFSFRGVTRPFKPSAKGHKSSPSGASEMDKGEGPQGAGSFAVRNRAMTTSSYASTTIPPKIETDLGFGASDFGSGFGDFLEGMGRRGSAIMEEPESYSSPAAAESMPMLSPPVAAYSGYNAPRSSGPPPVPLHAQPFSAHSGSTDLPDFVSAAARFGGFSTPAQTLARTPDSKSRLFEDADAKLVSDSVKPRQPQEMHVELKRRPVQSRFHVDASGKISREDSGVQHNAASGTSSSTNSLKTPSLSSAGSSLRTSEAPLSFQSGRNITPTTLFDGGRMHSNDTTPRARKADPYGEDEPLFGQATAGAVNTAVNFARNNDTSDAKPNKVMTPAQFERYRQQKELSRSKSDATKSESDESDQYDDEDETERNREQARQRRKQEAHLAVFRQQMMKSTGERTADLPPSPLTPSFDRAAQSAPNLLAGVGSKPQQSGSSSDDEDEDVPLGILKEHGFPNKNRPPNKVHASNSNGNLRAASQMGVHPPPPGSVAGSVVGAARGNLPPFARNLPADPYYGAGIVNPSNREPLAFNRSAGSVYGGGTNNSMPQLPPGGLVGVIAGEERARAMRRGSPNAQGFYGPTIPEFAPMPPQMPYQMPMMGAAPQMGMMGAPNMGIGMGAGMGMGMMSPGVDENVRMQQMLLQQQQQQLEMLKLQNMQMMQDLQALPTPVTNRYTQFFQGHGKRHGYTLRSLGPPPAYGSSEEEQLAYIEEYYARATREGALPPEESAKIRQDIYSKRLSVMSNAPSVNQQGRAMSMLAPPPQWGAPGAYTPSIPGIHLSPATGTGYAPSIAPSERSNVGMSPRYRPVHTNHAADAASTVGSSATVQPLTDDAHVADTIRCLERTKFVKSVMANSGAISEDDEEGWGDIKKKRGKKGFLSSKK